ncbi:ArsR/SmtB family transcription factor [Microtetraspora glauca]|uniref:Helix-turn-helix domain-containing protein n=1 Tax=Microtetraspora glauca TaxID=1996 RepID=A0ABV3GM30_MICGL
MAEADPRLKALAHPVRLRMLSLLWAAPMSAAELARELEISHALSSQHLRRLRTAGLAELVEIRSRRGGRERRYRAVRGTPLTDQRDEFPLIVETLVQTLRERAARRDPARSGVTADAELWVRAEVWDDVRERMITALFDLHDAAQAPRTPDTVHLAATVVAFPIES